MSSPVLPSSSAAERSALASRPVDERVVPGMIHASEKSPPEKGSGLNQPRNHDHRSCIQKAGWRGRREVRPHVRDSSFGDQNIGLEYAPLRILRHHRAPPNQEMPLGTRPDHAPWKISSLRTPI